MRCSCHPDVLRGWASVKLDTLMQQHTTSMEANAAWRFLVSDSFACAAGNHMLSDILK